MFNLLYLHFCNIKVVDSAKKFLLEAISADYNLKNFYESDVIEGKPYKYFSR